MHASPAFAHGPDRPLPDRADVAIIGGGVVGVTAALWLAEAGHEVLLCEKGLIAGEQSSRNWGWIRAQGRDLREMPLMLEAQAMWRALAPRLDVDVGLVQGGSTYLAMTEAEMAGHLAWVEKARPFQMTTRVLGRAEADALAGQSEGRFAGGIHTPTDMHAEPHLAVPALARLAASAGARIFEGTAVRGLQRVAGRVSGVVTEHGPVACDAVILAGGAWCRPFLENMGLSLPQLAVRSQAQRTAPAPRIAPGTIGTTGAAIRPRADGGYTVGRVRAARFDLIPAAFNHFRRFWPVLKDRFSMLKIRLGPEFFGALGRNRWAEDQMSPMETVRVFDPEPDRGILDEMMRRARVIYPQLSGVGVAQRWGGMIDVSPDEVPFIGPVAGAPGLTLATGLSGHGFGIGPGAGTLAAQMATGAAPLVDPAPYAPARYGV